MVKDSITAKRNRYYYRVNNNMPVWVTHSMVEVESNFQINRKIYKEEIGELKEIGMDCPYQQLYKMCCGFNPLFLNN